MKRKILGSLLIGVGIIGTVGAQQDPSYTHYAFNKLLYNPAYAGSSGNFCLNIVNHQQWLGYEDQSSVLKTQGGTPISDDFAQNIAPRTTGAAFSAPIKIKIKEEKVNVGGVFASFIKDNIAYEENTFFRGGLAGAYALPDGSEIRAGVEFTSLTKNLNGDKLRAHDPGDPNIPTGITGDTKLTMGGGIYYTNPNILNGLWGGVSMTHLMPQTFAYGNGGAVKISTRQHLYVTSGVTVDQFLGNPSLRFDPSFLVKSAMGDQGGFVKPELDLQGLVTYNELYAAGLNVRAYGMGLDAVSILLGYYVPLGGGAGNVQTLRVGYAYDIPVSYVRVASVYGTHELQINYCFNFELPSRPPRIYRHPRWMMRDVSAE